MKRIILFPALILLAAATLSGQCIQKGPCPAPSVQVCDLTPNQADLWNEAYWWSDLYETHDLAEAPVDLCFTATDECPGANLDIRYKLFLDLDKDGVRETLIESANPPAPNTVPFGNAGGTGSARAFDERSVPAGQKFAFALQQTGTAGNRTACLRWNTADAPNLYVIPKLPYGAHKIRWIVENGLGETDSCEYVFVVDDCKKPTLVCINGLSANLMPTQMIQLWAVDFLQYMEDNATPTSKIDIAIRRVGAGTGFPVDSAGNPQKSTTFTCDDIGQQLVELWARDLQGNADFCETYVLIQDQNGNCGGLQYIDARFCARQWSTNTVVSGVEWGLYFLPDHPPIQVGQIDADGCYDIDQWHHNLGNGTVTPSKDQGPLNGLDVFDLIKIQKHILGLEPLEPYSMIAADANKSNSVTSFDIVQIRQLLTGILFEFPNNTSWRFIDADFVFVNPNNPFQTVFPESKQLTGNNGTSLDSLLGEISFVAVKVGDVDGSALPGFQSSGPEDRAPVQLTLADRTVQAGEMFDLPVFPAENGTWLGFQLGLKFDPAQLIVETVLPGDLPNREAYSAAQPLPGLFHLLWYDVAPRALPADAPLFTLRCKALAPLRLSEVLRVSEAHLPARAILETEERAGLKLHFEAATTEGTTIGLPRPNPTTGATRIGLQLAENASVRVEIHDVQGRLLWASEQWMEAGTSQITLPASAFPFEGVYTWRVLAGVQVRSGKVVLRR